MTLAEQARGIFHDALAAVDPGSCVRQNLLCGHQSIGLRDYPVPFSGFDAVLLIAVGKAALRMGREALEILDSCGISEIETIIVTNEVSAKQHAHLRILPGAHPLPDGRSVAAARAVLYALERVTERTLVLFLISGGGSAMLELPLDPRVSIDDLAAFHRALIGSGLGITQMNALRKHLSAVKGGRLAVAAAKARAQLTLLVSDVPAAAPDAIGSGPSLPDSSTIHHCYVLLEKVREHAHIATSIEEFFAGSALAPFRHETPKAGDGCFARSAWRVIASSEQLADAALEAARRRGFAATLDNTCDDWEYRRAGDYLLQQAMRLARVNPRGCLVSAGEVTLELPTSPGTGGRNQQLALWCAQELRARNIHATVLSCGSDGIDGMSDAAGAVCDEHTFARAAALGLSVHNALARFDTTALLDRIGATIRTGPTGNNLRDLRLVLWDDGS